MRYLKLLLLLLLFSSFTPERYYLLDKGEGKLALVNYIKELHEKGKIGETPLIVVDGKPYRYEVELKESPLQLTFDDIENIDFLKAKKGIAIFGDEGKNGVLLITRKRAKDGDILPVRTM